MPIPRSHRRPARVTGFVGLHPASHRGRTGRPSPSPPAQILHSVDHVRCATLDPRRCATPHATVDTDRHSIPIAKPLGGGLVQSIFRPPSRRPSVRVLLRRSCAAPPGEKCSALIARRREVNQLSVTLKKGVPNKVTVEAQEARHHRRRSRLPEKAAGRRTCAQAGAGGRNDALALRQGQAEGAIRALRPRQYRDDRG